MLQAALHISGLQNSAPAGDEVEKLEGQVLIFFSFYSFSKCSHFISFQKVLIFFSFFSFSKCSHIFSHFIPSQKVPIFFLILFLLKMFSYFLSFYFFSKGSHIFLILFHLKWFPYFSSSNSCHIFCPQNLFKRFSFYFLSNIITSLVKYCQKVKFFLIKSLS